MNQLAFPVHQAPPYNQPSGPLNPAPIGNGTYTSWPGGVDPSVNLYAGNPVPLSMQRGGRMLYRKASRKNNRKASRKTRRVVCRKANRKANRKASRKARRMVYRKASRKNSRKSCRKN